MATKYPLRLLFFLSLFFLVTLNGVEAQQLAPLELPDKRMLFCVWPDINTADLSIGNDRPVLVNGRFGFNVSAFQFTQSIPVNWSYGQAPLWMLSETGTDAYAVLTVLADSPTSLDAITPQDINELAGQITELSKNGRKVFLRLLPEMN
ncbi:hypothetical protein HK102_008233, partial [Quaeritorhiza haematococci]